MPNIKQITLPSGTTYDIVDQGARDLIDALGNYTVFLGVTSTALTDGATTNPVVINGESVTARTGDIVTYGSQEFIFNGTAWQAFGDLSGLGSLAFKNSASGNFTPQGSVTVGTSASKHAVSKASSGATTYTPEGTVGLASTGGQNYTVSKASSGTATYTPEGSVSLTNTSKNISLDRAAGTSSNYTVKEAKTVTVGTTSTTPTVTIAEGSSSDYQVTGTVGTPTITVTPSTTTVNSITAVGTLPTLTTTVANENLTIGWSAGTLPTKGSDTTVATGIQSATSTQPSFSGGRIKATASSVTTPTGSSTITYDYTVLSDSLDVPTSASFSGTGARLVTESIDVPSSAQFVGTAVRLETDNITSPSGTNSFNGTQGTVTVS